MTQLSIQHRTTYTYQQAVHFGAHRLMLRPRESRSLRITAHDLVISPTSSISWSHDVFGNSVASAQFTQLADTLDIHSSVQIELDTERWPVFDVSVVAARYPFKLTDDEMMDLGALRLQSYLDAEGQLQRWTQAFLSGQPTDTLDLLTRVSTAVATSIAYEIREEERTQSPVETLQRKKGSCRDLATLFVDATRNLGFGARIVSGYLYDADTEVVGTTGQGSTHAWAEVYVPGAGWITFDPTNRSVGGYNLIPVAVARHIRQVIPVAGSYIGSEGLFDLMSVEVHVAEARASKSNA